MVPSVTESVDNRELGLAFEQALAAARGAPVHVSQLERREFANYTSYGLEEVDAVVDDQPLALLRKDLHYRALGEQAQKAKPKFLYNPLREIETYRCILAPRNISSPAYFGAVVRPERERYWLFLERVQGQELYQIGDFDLWLEVARGLAWMHSQLQGEAPALLSAAPLLVYDGAYYARWIKRARQFAAGKNQTAQIERLAQRYDRVIEHLTKLTPTFLHGEFYPSNILVVSSAAVPRICPVDWEMAAVGPGLMDLGALIAGHWTEEEKEAMARAYYLALPPPRSSQWEEFLVGLDYARLQLAVQWLGWSPDWTPPSEHANDWLEECMLLAEKLEL